MIKFFKVLVLLLYLSIVMLSLYYYVEINNNIINIKSSVIIVILIIHSLILYKMNYKIKYIVISIVSCVLLISCKYFIDEMYYKFITMLVSAIFYYWINLNLFLLKK